MLSFHVSRKRRFINLSYLKKQTFLPEHLALGEDARGDVLQAAVRYVVHGLGALLCLGRAKSELKRSVETYDTTWLSLQTPPTLRYCA